MMQKQRTRCDGRVRTGGRGAGGGSRRRELTNFLCGRSPMPLLTERICHGATERERQGDPRDRPRDRETGERPRDRETGRQNERPRDRETGRQSGRGAKTHTACFREHHCFRPAQHLSVLLANTHHQDPPRRPSTSLDFANTHSPPLTSAGRANVASQKDRGNAASKEIERVAPR
eukprot:1128033-Rhodomonas_salina.2